MKMQLATILSRIFDPFGVLAILLIVALYKSTLVGFEQVRFIVISLVTMIGIPVALLYGAIKKGIVANWDISRREERPKVLFTLLIIEAINLLLIRGIADAFLFGLFVFIFAAMLGFTLVTLFWKISGHAFVSALVSGLIVSWYGISFWPVLLIVPLVGWARIVRHDHTPLQVIAGASYSWLLVIIFQTIV